MTIPDRAFNACRSHRETAIASIRPRQMRSSLTSLPPNCAGHLNDLLWRLVAVRRIRWVSSSSLELSVTTKSEGLRTFTRSAALGSTSGKNAGTKRSRALLRLPISKRDAASEAKSGAEIWAGDSTKRSSSMDGGRNLTAIRSNSLAPGRAAKDRGTLSAMHCCTPTAITFTSPNRLNSGSKPRFADCSE